MIRFFCLLIVAGSMLLSSGISLASEGCGHECASCHKLSKQEAQDALKSVPNTRVVNVADAPVRGLWQIQVEQAGKKKVLYLDYGKENIIVGKIVPTGKKPTAAPKDGRVDLKSLDFDNSLMIGEKTASRRVAVFSDPNCSHCRMFHETMLGIIKEHKDIAFAIFLYPLNPNPTSPSYVTSRSIMCERSLTLLNDAYKGLPVPEKKCSDQALANTIAIARKYRIDGTPAIVFPNGVIHFGALDAKSFLDLLSKNLK